LFLKWTSEDEEYKIESIWLDNDFARSKVFFREPLWRMSSLGELCFHKLYFEIWGWKSAYISGFLIMLLDHGNLRLESTLQFIKINSKVIGLGWDYSGYMEMCALVESGVVSSYMPPVVHVAASEFLPTLRWEGNRHLKFEDYDHSWAYGLQYEDITRTD